MPRLYAGRSERADLTLLSDTADPIFLRFDRERTKGPLALHARFLPNETGYQGGLYQGNLSLQEWRWSNGPGGAGTSIETAASYADGSCSYGTFVWLRRLGVAMAAGKLTEITLPPGTAATTGSASSAALFEEGLTFGGDLILTTRSNYIVRVPGATGATALQERDTGAPGVTLGIGIFDGTGTSKLYVGDVLHGIQEWDGVAWATWSVGAAGTERGFLKVPYWAGLGTNLATGGASGEAGSSDDRLVGTSADSASILHTASDPKIAGNWSSALRMGPASNSYTIHRLVADAHTVWAGTGQGVIGANSLGYTPNLTPWMVSTASLDTCRQITYWDGMIFAGHEQGLVAFRPDGSRVDFGTFLQFGAKAGTTPIWGRPNALCGTPDGLVVGYYNGTDSYVGCLVKDPDGSYRWSMAEAVIPNQRVTYVQQVVGTDSLPRLWIGTVDSGGKLHLYTQSLPRTGDPENDIVHGGPGFVPAEDWTLFLSRFDGQRSVPKTVRRLMGQFDRLGTSYPANKADVLVSADGGSYVVAGSATSSPRWSSIPTTALVQAASLQVQLQVHNVTTAPVIVRDVSVRYSPHPELTKVVTYPIIASDNVVGDDPAVLVRRLEAVQDAGPITYEDELGQTRQGIVEVVAETLTAEAFGWTLHADVVISSTHGTDARFDDARFDESVFS